MYWSCSVVVVEAQLVLGYLEITYEGDDASAISLGVYEMLLTSCFSPRSLN